MDKSPSYVGRLAPAPTGALHLGNARTFLIAWLRARKAGGRILLRLEDLDHPKVKPAAARQAYQDLRWLGLDCDAGPADSTPPFTQSEDAEDPYVQSRNLGKYSHALNSLKERERVYPCVCTRKDLEQYLSAPNAGEEALERRYPGACRDRFASSVEAEKLSGREPAWRFRVEDGAETEFVDGFHGPQRSVLSEWSGDFPVARGQRAGYQLAVVVDDHGMGVTEVVRGDDLLPSTHRQIALYRALGWEPPSFYHIPLVVGPDGRRLAKRHGDTRISAIRESGTGPWRVLGWLAKSCGWIDGLREIPLAEILDLCDFDRIPRERVVVERADLDWLGL